MVVKVNFTLSDVETLASSKSKKRHLCKESPEFPSPDQQQCMLERSEGLKLSQCRRGCPKGLGKRSDSKEKLKLPDLTRAIERVLVGSSVAKLTPSCQPLEEDNVFGQNVAKRSNNMLDDNRD